MNRKFAVMRMGAEILDVFGLFDNIYEAKASAEHHSKQDAGVNDWVVFEYPGYGRWRATNILFNRRHKNVCTED